MMKNFINYVLNKKLKNMKNLLFSLSLLISLNSCVIATDSLNKNNKLTTWGIETCETDIMCVDDEKDE